MPKAEDHFTHDQLCVGDAVLLRDADESVMRKRGVPAASAHTSPYGDHQARTFALETAVQGGCMIIA